VREDPTSEVARAGADLEDDVRLLEPGFGDDGVGDARVFKDVLAAPRFSKLLMQTLKRKYPRSVFMRKMLFAAECFSGRAIEYGASRPGPWAFFCRALGIMIEFKSRMLCDWIWRSASIDLE
jgi:hypothetical protein